MEKLRTRFAPSPTGSLHVGGARTALFNFLLARQTGGTFLVRIEDTDRERHEEDAVARIVEDLRWLGLDWDEGIAQGGPRGPYRQSERLELYARYVERLVREGKAYYAFETEEELEALRRQAQADKTGFRYRRPEKFPTDADADLARAAGRPVVIRFCCGDRDVTVHDDAFGEVVVPASEMEDFVIRKADGFPTFYLANVVDDALMEINYVMRGQEFLGQTWRQTLLRQALGFPEPRCCHLPLILDGKGRKLSKRDGDVDVRSFRAAGYLPEALVNFMALLGWCPASGKERMSLSEMIELFGVDRIGRTNAKFDRDKLLAFNTDAAAAATPDRLLAAFQDYLSLCPDSPLPRRDEGLLRQILQVNKGFRTFADLSAKCGVLFQPDDSFPYDPEAVKKVLQKGGAGYAVLAEIQTSLREAEWSHAGLEKLLNDFCAASGAGLGKVAQPIRVAVTGTVISPPIVETLLFLGRDKTLARIARCLSLRAGGA